MTYFKYIPYLFLVVAILFLVDGIQKLQEGKNAMLSFIFTGIGIFMFFFRRWSYNKYYKRKE